MKSKRGILLVALPAVAGAGLLLAALATRRGPELEPPRRSKKAEPQIARAGPEVRSPQYSVKNLPKPAPADVAIKASEEVRLQGTYQNYRTAMATGNVMARNALEKVLLRDRDAALRMAQEEVGRAKTERDREIATMTLEALRR